MKPHGKFLSQRVKYFFYIRIGYKELVIDEKTGEFVSEYDLKDTPEEVLEQVQRIKEKHPHLLECKFRFGAIIE
jgi:hypothetical protein